MSFHVPNKFRYRDMTHPYGSDDSIGNSGAFWVPLTISNRDAWVIASDGEGWEHVSVSLKNRTPNWAEMCQVKDLFWDDEDAVIQIHPPKSNYVNQHPYCLHLWRPTKARIPLPDNILVGIDR